MRSEYFGLLGRVLRFADTNATVNWQRSLAGRLLLRKFALEKLRLRSDEVLFERTKEGRPVLVRQFAHDLSLCMPMCDVWMLLCCQAVKMPNGSPSLYDFNVTHHGDWVVLAAAPHWCVDGSLQQPAAP